jgi:23S rRNA pseudouridine1911/1915/1917 synthase
LRFTAGSDDAGARLDLALAARAEITSRAEAQRLIDRGAVTVDGLARPKRYRLEPGDRVEVTLDSPPAPVVPDVDIPIVHQDEHLMVVDKPAGLVVHPAPGHRGATLVDMLSGTAGGEHFRPGVVHRLDRDTSGLLILAKTPAAHAALERMIRNREVRREYLALVDGHLDARAGTIDAPIGRDRRNRTIHSTRTDRPREARTHFSVVRVYGRTTLLRARLETGRTHQIRAHLAAIGHPVCGDSAYGGGPCGVRLALTRQFLHAAHLSFAHPFGGASVCCESNLPVDLRHASDAAAREPASEGPDGG